LSIDQAPPASAPQPSRGLAARVVGVLTSPRATYADVAAHPRWLGVLIVVLLATTVPTVWLLSTPVGQQASLDQQMQALESFGVKVSDEMYQQMEQRAPYSAAIAGVSQVVLLPLSTLLIAGIAFGIFNGALGADAAFRQVFAVAAYSTVVGGLRTLFSAPLNYARESLSSPTNLASVLPVFDDASFPGRLLGSIDLFLIWWILNLAIGLAVLYRRRTAPIATTMFVVYAAIAVTIAAVRSVFAGA
jgi:Yip1-like protein